MFIKMELRTYLSIIIFLFTTSVYANEVEIVNVVLSKYAGTWRADVTLKHDDAGWKHYADAWRIIDENGKEIGKRTLHHPHVNEQPFTRSLNDFYIKNDIKVIYVEAHDSKHGWSSDRVKIKMNKSSGHKYKIKSR